MPSELLQDCWRLLWGLSRISTCVTNKLFQTTERNMEAEQKVAMRVETIGSVGLEIEMWESFEEMVELGNRRVVCEG